MKRCTVVIPDAGPFISLWVADRLDLLLALDMRLVLVDAVYDELTSDLSCPKDKAVKDFIDSNQPPFVIETTEIGEMARARRSAGGKPKKNACELAIFDFMSSEDGLRSYVDAGEPVFVLYQDADMRIFNKPPHLHLLSTAGLLRGLERIGVISSADEVLHDMTHPNKPDRRPPGRRNFIS